ncbi:YraN family protein [Rhizobium sp. 0TCS1.26]|jgi:putative endonuclease|uniref:YraN family protein n=1 Tax=Rhizobium sp. 0TCS1.26 TaxID=3142623 RepID=UPI003D2C08A3
MAADDPIGRRRKAERHGRFSEYVAALYLIARGYRILAMRYRTPVGEIDIIARKRDLVAFVEVKARRQEMQAIAAVSAMSQRRIRAASDLWLGRRRDGHRLSQRYDILVIRPWRLPRHFPDAF